MPISARIRLEFFPSPSYFSVVKKIFGNGKKTFLAVKFFKMSVQEKVRDGNFRHSRRKKKHCMKRSQVSLHHEFSSEWYALVSGLVPANRRNI